MRNGIAYTRVYDGTRLTLALGLLCAESAVEDFAGEDVADVPTLFPVFFVGAK